MCQLPLYDTAGPAWLLVGFVELVDGLLHAGSDFDPVSVGRLSVSELVLPLGVIRVTFRWEFWQMLTWLASRLRPAGGRLFTFSVVTP